jgi:hypothetical protein
MEHPSPLLAPMVALILWSLVMMVWMYATRLPAMRRAGIVLKGRKGSRPGQLDDILPPNVQWKAHNYAHLMEQPTLFYAAVAALVLMGFDAWINVWIAWAYVGLRVAHSLVQSTSNLVPLRFALFLLSSLCLLSLGIHAALFLWHRG